MDHPSERWQKTEEIISHLLERVRGDVSEETADAVRHYLLHAEYEMALEGLIIDLMAARPTGVELDWLEVTQVASELGLDRETTFDPEFWQKFVEYSRAQPMSVGAPSG